MKTKALFSLLAIAMLILFASLPASATDYTLLGGKATTGAGTAVTPDKQYKLWVCQMNISGAPSEIVAYVQGNVTGVTYTTMYTWTLSTDTYYANGQSVFTVANMPAKQVRGYVNTITGGTAPTVTMICSGVE
jgi:hypothetical protein